MKVSARTHKIMKAQLAYASNLGDCMDGVDYRTTTATARPRPRVLQFSAVEYAPIAQAGARIWGLRSSWKPAVRLRRVVGLLQLEVSELC